MKELRHLWRSSQKASLQTVGEGDHGVVNELTRDGGKETGSKAKLHIRDSCNLDFCKVIATVRISSFASGLRSSGTFESADGIELIVAALTAGSISWTPEANLTAGGAASDDVLVVIPVSFT